MAYIDGFVAAVPNANKQKFIDMSKKMSAIFRENGALRTVDTWGDDVPEGKTTSFPMAVKCEADETVAFSWIWWPDKKTREEGFAKAMQDPRMNDPENAMPFDGKRIIFGGFEVIVEE